MGSAGSSALQATQTQQNHHWGSLPPAIDIFETRIEGSTGAIRRETLENDNLCCMLQLRPKFIKKNLSYPPYSPERCRITTYINRWHKAYGSSISILMIMPKNRSIVEEPQMACYLCVHIIAMLSEKWENLMATMDNGFNEMLLTIFFKYFYEKAAISASNWIKARYSIFSIDWLKRLSNSKYVFKMAEIFMSIF